MPAELSNATNVIGFVTAFQYANSLTRGIFSALIIAIVTLITFILMKDYDTPRALAGSSFIGFLLSIFFWGIGLIGYKIFAVFFFILVMSVFVAAAQNR